MTNHASDDPFTQKMEDVRSVLFSGEGFTDAEVAYQDDNGGAVLFRARDAHPFKMRRAEFDGKTAFEIAFYVATRMRKAPPVVAKPERRARTP